MALPFTQIINNFLKTKPYKQLQDGTWIPQGYGRNIPPISASRNQYPDTITDSRVEVLISNPNPIVIDSLEWGVYGNGASTSLAPWLFEYGDTGGSFGNHFTYVNEFGYRADNHPEDVGDYGTNWWDIRHYDTSNFSFAFSLRRPIFMPSGCELVIGRTDTNYNAFIGYHVVAREV